jgi:hypothetical protein
MDSAELIRTIPDFLGRYIEGVEPKPLVPQVEGLSAGAWSYSLGGIVTTLKFTGEAGEMRVTNGLAIDIPYKTELTEYVNWLNMKQMVFGRLFLIGNIPFMSETGDGLCAVLMQEIFFGEGLSFDFAPSMQNLIETVARMGGQGSRFAPDLVDRYGGRPFTDDDAMILALQ